MILMPQIFDVTANENACYKQNELEYEKFVSEFGKWYPKSAKKAEAKRDGVINPQNYNFNQFWYGKFWCSQNATNQPDLATCALWVSLVHQQWHNYQVVKI